MNNQPNYIVEKILYGLLLLFLTQLVQAQHELTKFGYTDYFKDSIYEWKKYEPVRYDGGYSPNGLVLRTNILRYGLETNFNAPLGFRAETEIDAASFLEKSKNATFGFVCWNTAEDHILGIFLRSDGTMTATFILSGNPVFKDAWINIPANEKNALKLIIRCIRGKYSFFVNGKEFAYAALKNDKLSFDWIGYWLMGDAEMPVGFFDFEAFQ